MLSSHNRPIWWPSRSSDRHTSPGSPPDIPAHVDKSPEPSRRQCVGASLALHCPRMPGAAAMSARKSAPKSGSKIASKAAPKIGSATRTAKSALQFAPNFTAYVLPPDVVCIYSEDRKFFLHGELYCALASAIGKGGKNFRELVLELEKDFPSDKFLEALTRLVFRRYVLPASRSSAGAAAAYWA